MTRRTFTNRFNRGEVDPLAIARQDVERIKNSAALMDNWMPVRLGPMQTRPGTKALAATIDSAYFVPFVKAIDDVALLEFGDGKLRVWLDDAPITRPPVTGTIPNGDFSAGLTSWTNISPPGTFAGPAGLSAILQGDGVLEAGITNTLTVNQVNREHSVTISIGRGIVRLTLTQISTGAIIFDGQLTQGTHSLAFTPTGNVTVTLRASTLYSSTVGGVIVQASGDMVLPTDIPIESQIRFAQSQDVVFLSSTSGVIQKRIERRGRRSWSVVDYLTDDGPFDNINLGTVTIRPTSIDGGGLLIASGPVFKPTDVNRLIKIESDGQTRRNTVNTSGVNGRSIKVTGDGTASRSFTLTITGTFVGTVTLERSFDDINWSTVISYTAPVTNTQDDSSLFTTTVYYRLVVKDGALTSGSLTMSLAYTGGSITGIARIYAVTSSTNAAINVLQPFGNTTATKEWYLGSWAGGSYPTAVAFFEGRLWWAGMNRLWGSVSDGYVSFDRTIEGDSASIVRTIGFGPTDDINWLAVGATMTMGIASNEILVRSNSFGQPLTQNNTNLRKGSSQGSANLDYIEADNRIYYTQRSLRKMFQIRYDQSSDSSESLDLNVLTPTLMGSDIVRVAVTRQPETRLYVVLADGTMRVLLEDVSEDVRGWARWTPAGGGQILDVVVLPGLVEDAVYTVINRFGTRILERVARFDQCIGALRSNHLDSAVYYTLPNTATLTGLTHLIGRQVRVWADGQDIGSYTVPMSGTIVVPAVFNEVTVGLQYQSNYKSNKLTDYVDGSVLNQNKRVTRIGLVMQNTVTDGISYGSDPSVLRLMPLLEDGVQDNPNTTVSTYDELVFEFDGTYDSDSRVYLRATLPATIMAMTVEVDDPNYPINQA